MIALWLNLSFLLLAADPSLPDGLGTLSGKVFDAANHPIAGATVSVQREGDPSPASTSSARTGPDGAFQIASLQPGVYSIEVGKPGFQTFTRREDLTASLQASLTGTLFLRPARERALPEQSSGIDQASQVLDSEAIASVPLLRRDVLSLALLDSGVTAGAGGNNVNISINGQREFANSIVVNGIEVTGNRNNETDLRPSLEAVEEIAVTNAGLRAETGRTGAGVVAVTTKSGSDEFHGTAYGFLRVPATAARGFFSKESTRDSWSDFGGSLGGPGIHAGMHFFAAYERKTQLNSFSYLSTTVPRQMIGISPAGADLSRLADPFTGRTVPIFDPLSYRDNFVAAQFPNNRIPATRISPAGLRVLQQLFPAPNVPGTLNGWVNNFAVSQPYRFHSDTGDVRLDFGLKAGGHLSVTYDTVVWNSRTADPFGNSIAIPGGGGTDSADRTESLNRMLGVAYTKRMGSDAVNSVRFGFLQADLRQDTLIQGDVSSQLGMANIAVKGFPATFGLPQFYLGFGASTGGSTYKPLSFADRNISLAEAYDVSRGRHTMRVGYEFRRLRAQPRFSLFPTGYQYYNGAYASLTSDPNFSFFDPNAYYGNGGSEVADLLLGLPGFVTLGLQLTSPSTQSFEHHAFFEDTVRVTAGLTIDVGIRYEYQSPYRETHGQEADFDPGSLSLVLPGAGRRLIHPDRNNFAPRVGIAWRPDSRDVVRAGYSLAYTPENSARSDLLTKNYPFMSNQQFLNTPFDPGVYVLDQGVARQSSVSIPPGVASIGLAELKSLPRQTLLLVDPNLRTGYVQTPNFGLERRLAEGLTLEADYVGAFSRKLPYEVGNLNLNGRLSSLLGTIQSLYSEGNASYHSLQVVVRSRHRGPVDFLLSYTYAKALDNGPAPFNLGKNHQVPQDAWNLSMERGPSSADVRHNLNVTYLWTLPFRGRGLANDFYGNVLRGALAGWQLSGVTSLRSGLPVNVVRNGNVTGYEGLRPNVLGDPNLGASARTLSHYFSTEMFSVTGLARTQAGNTGRNVLRGPGFVNIDVRLLKTIPVRGDFQVETGVEAFNATNTPHFANPNTDMSTGGFGSITGTIGNSRLVQFSVMLKF